MGLDNGIIVKFKKKPFLMPRLEKCSLSKDNTFEAAYWRKCWDIRNTIFEVINEHEPDTGYIILNTKNINKIIKVLKLYNVKEVYEESDWYWTWETMHPKLTKQIRILTWLKIYMILFPGNIEEVYFYDSY